MSYINWDASRELGHRMIDEDHRAMAALINALVDELLACDGHAAGAHREHLLQLMHELRDTTERHFAEEEAYMADDGYPGLETHRQQHKTLLAEYSAFVRLFQSGRPQSMPHMIRFWREWLEYHVASYDRAYVKWLVVHQPELLSIPQPVAA